MQRDSKIISVVPNTFTKKELQLYEQKILDNKKLTEQEASHFFSEYPKFLSVGGYSQIAREITLYKPTGESIYRIDFCRRKYGNIYWDLIELKSPQKPIIVKKGNHWKFSSIVESSEHQANDYKDFLEQDINRIELERRTGIKILRPKILIIAGRDSQEIASDDLRRMYDRFHNIELNTYDDIYNFALEFYTSSIVIIPIIQHSEIEDYPVLDDIIPSIRCIHDPSKKNNDVYVIDLEGHLDARNCRQLDNSFNKLVKNRNYNIVINFKDLNSISSAGLGVFMGYIELLRENKGDIKFSDMNPSIFNVFELLGFTVLYEFFRDESQAVTKYFNER